jgi:WD40 repeat protein
MPIDLILAKALELLAGSQLVKDKLQRNEIVIRVLKQLGLDPEHPPADFEGVYNYALVEYGVGKPKPCLEIFRASEIRRVFRTAFDQNNAQRWLTSGEQFLESSAIGDAVKTLGLDPKLELAAFASCFIVVAKRTRTPGDVLMSHQVASMQQTLMERLDQIPTLEGIRTELARVAGSDTPMLAGAAAQSCRAFVLAQQMRGWFETLGYRFGSHEVWGADYFEWIIDIPVRRGRYDRVLVRGIDGEVGIKDVRSLSESVTAQKADEGWVVTARRISQAARGELTTAECEGLAAFTLDELLDQEADFGGYLDWLAVEIEARGIEARYVPIACTKEEVDPLTHQRLGISRYGQEDGWTEGYIDRWVDDPTKEHLSILGEFGTGKTWLTLHYAAQALRAYREAQGKGMNRPRLPIVIPLRDYAKAVSVESLFSEFFFRKHKLPIPHYDAFLQLNRMGKLLLIFDGFDEMAARVDKQQMINNFWELAKVVVPGSKVILTCRTEHFPEAREGRALLNAELQASTKGLSGETPQFEVLELEKFEDEQIRQVLSLSASEATVAQVMGNPQLLDLARRPVMTELILEALPEIEAGKPVDMSRVYLYAVRRKMERDIKADRTFTSMADKLYFLCELSWEMLSNDKMSINYREIPDRIRKLFGAAVQEEKDLDHWHYDMMGQTMLIRNADGDYTPAHRSLLEFFVAFKFAAELGALAPDFLELAQMKSGIDRALEPREYSWSEYFAGGAVAPLKGFKTENLEGLRSGFGRAALSKAVVDLLAPIVVEIISGINDWHLYKVIQKTRNKSEDAVGYIGGNAMTLFVKNLDHSAGLILAGLNFTHTVIRGADLTKGYLTGADFSHSVIRELKTLQSFGAIFTTSYSPTGKLFVSAGANCTISLWESSKNQIIQSFTGHTEWIRDVIFSHDENFLISASFDETIRIWDIQIGICRLILKGHTKRINSVALSLDSRYLVSGSDDCQIRIWDIKSGVCLKILSGHTKAVEKVIIHNDCKTLVSCGSDGLIKLWNIPSSFCIQTLDGHSDRVFSIDISPDGKSLISSSFDQTIRCWNLNEFECTKIIREPSESDRMYSVKYSPDGKFFAGSSSDKTIKLWSLKSGLCIRKFVGHDDWVRAISFSNDGLKLLSGSDDKTVKIWDVITGECLKTLEGYSAQIRALSVSPNGDEIFVGCEDNSLQFIQWEKNEHVRARSRSLAHDSRINGISFNPDKRLLATASFDKTVKLWNLRGSVAFDEIAILKGHTGCVNTVLFSPDSNFLASAGADCSVKLWNLKTRNCVSTLTGHNDWIWTLAISPNSELVASGSDDQSAKIWDVKSQRCIASFDKHSGGISSVLFAQEGKALITGCKNGTIYIWNIETGVCQCSWSSDTNFLMALALSPSGNELVSSGRDKELKVWSLATGECLNILKGHTDGIRAISFSSDGNLVSGSFDQSIKVWNIETGCCLKSFKINRPYESMNITGVKGLPPESIATLKALGAIEDEEVSETVE